MKKKLTMKEIQLYGKENMNFWKDKRMKLGRNNKNLWLNFKQL